MVTTHCATARQCPPSQAVKPRISNRRRNARNRYGAGVIITAVTQVEDRSEIKKELIAETVEFP